MMMATCWLLNEVGANMQLTYKASVLEVLNSTEDGTNVWQLGAHKLLSILRKVDACGMSLC